MAQEYQRKIITQSVEGWSRDIPLYDIFEETVLKWYVTAAGDGTGAHDTTIVHIGSGSFKATTGVVQYQTVSMTKGIGPLLPKIVKSGFFMHFTGALQELTTTKFGIQYKIFGEDTIYASYIKVVIDTNFKFTLSVSENYDSSYEEIATNLDLITLDIFIPISFKVDLKTGKYVSVSLGGRVFDASAYSLAKTTITNIDPGSVILKFMTDEAAEKITYFDAISVEYE